MLHLWEAFIDQASA